MRKILQNFCLLPLLAILIGCASGPSIRSDIDPQADFAQYRSFAFSNPLGTDKAGYTTILTDRLKAATRLQMEQRGYVYDEQALVSRF